MIQTYHRPSTADEAVALAAEGAVFLAGGTQVNRAPADRRVPAAVVDLRDVVPTGVRFDGTDTVVGALTTLQEIVDDDRLPEALRSAAGFIPTRSVRNIASIGGNVGAGRPDSYLIPALIALGGLVRTSEGEVAMVENFIVEKSGALIMEIIVPEPLGSCVAVKESRSQLALPVVSAAVGLVTDGGDLTAAIVAAGCVAERTVRLRHVEEALVAGHLDDRETLERAIREEIQPRADILGSVEYKTYVNGTVIAGAVERCREALK